MTPLALFILPEAPRSHERAHAGPRFRFLRFELANVEKWENAFCEPRRTPRSLFREVKATAARQGMRLKDYITEALQDKLATSSGSPLRSRG